MMGIISLNLDIEKLPIDNAKLMSTNLVSQVL